MKTRITRIILTSCCMAVTIAPQPVAAGQASKEECRAMKKKIDHYQDLRRKGGSGAQMDSWKRQLREFEERYREARCKQYGKAFW